LPGDPPAASVVLEGPLDGIRLEACAEQPLSPTLRPGDRTAKPHKMRVLPRPSNPGDQPRHLPSYYSPDLIPVASALAKLKAFSCRGKEWCMDALRSRTGRLLHEFSSAEYLNHVRHYGSTFG
jgi:hypothetical protein